MLLFAAAPPVRRVLLARTRHATRGLCTAHASVERGVLYVVGVPIGNLGDISARGKHVLSGADVIAAEDTRVTGLLLSHLSIAPRGRLLSCHAHNAGTRIPRLLSALATGSVALVSDAGTPCISDPGSVVVRAARTAGYRISPVPGACAAAAALSASGLGGGGGHLFVGFLPRGGGERTRRLGQCAASREPVVLYEAAGRVVGTLRDLAGAGVGEGRAVCVGRELTKRYEAVHHFGHVGEAARYFEHEQPRGEFVLVVEGAARGEREGGVGETRIAIDKLGAALLEAGVGVKTASQVLAQSSSLSKKEVYQYLLGVKAKAEGGDNLVHAER